jgi:hypothetical protein
VTTINIESRKVTRQQPAKPHKQRACLYLEKRLRVSHEKAARTASSVARSSGFGFITLLIKSRRSSCTPADSASRTEGTQMLASQSTGRSSIDLVTSRTCPEWLARVKDDTLRSQKVKTRTAGAVHGPYSAVARDLRQSHNRSNREVLLLILNPLVTFFIPHLFKVNRKFILQFVGRCSKSLEASHLTICNSGYKARGLSQQLKNRAKHHSLAV